MSRPNTPSAGSASGSHGLPAGAWSTRQHTTPHTRPVPPPPTRASTSSSQGLVVADPGTHPTTSQGQARHSRVTRPARATHRHGGISLPCVPPQGTGAVNSPAGLGTGQPRFA